MCVTRSDIDLLDVKCQHFIMLSSHNKGMTSWVEEISPGVPEVSLSQEWDGQSKKHSLPLAK